jgi:hypothetical protein
MIVGAGTLGMLFAEFLKTYLIWSVGVHCSRNVGERVGEGPESTRNGLSMKSTVTAFNASSAAHMTMPKRVVDWTFGT